MLLPGLKSVASFFVAAIFVFPAFADNPTPPMPPTVGPGSLNYVEGQVSVNTELINPQSMPPPQLHPSDSLTTEQGKAELLLTPGVFLRVGDNSSVKMISPGLANTVVEVDKGHALVEVDDIYKQNDIRVIEGAANVRLLKTGLYDFDLRQNELRVFDGKAMVEIAGHEITVKREHDLNFTNPSALKSQKFDPKPYENDDLYRWSSLRSAYLAEANVNLGRMYAANNYGDWVGADWYWDPWFDAYTFLPFDGIFYSPSAGDSTHRRGALRLRSTVASAMAVSITLAKTPVTGESVRPTSPAPTTRTASTMDRAPRARVFTPDHRWLDLGTPDSAAEVSVGAASTAAVAEDSVAADLVAAVTAKPHADFDLTVIDAAAKNQAA
ncbi:MAG: hypothetical protein WA532_13225 [Candidatus Korobacteraceae bacterium]